MSSSNTSADLLIVGGGVLGAFHAYHAIARGLSVILLERNAASRGATVRNFGQVVPSGMDPTWQRFGRESLEIYGAIQSKFDISVRQQGSIYIASDDEELTLIEELHAINSKNGYESEVWSSSQCRSRYPQLRSDYCRGGLFFPQEISVNPRVMIHRLHQYLSEQPNFQGHFASCVNALRVDNAGRVTAKLTDGQEFKAENAIVCSGDEFKILFPAHFQKSDLTAVKLQMLRLCPPKELGSQASLPGNVLTGLSIRRYESFAQCPSWNEIKSKEPADSFAKKWGVHILFKQEIDGGIILGDSHEYASVKDYDKLGFDLREDINDFMLAEAAKIFDLPSWKIETAWSGIYSQTSDPKGIHTQTIDNAIHVVTGIGGKGMTSSAGFSKYHLGEIYND